MVGWDKNATPLNVKSWFRCTGICPFDRGVFSEEDFLSCYLTDRPLATAKTTEPITEASVIIPSNNEPQTSGSSSNWVRERESTPTKTHIISPSKAVFPKGLAKKSIQKRACEKKIDYCLGHSRAWRNRSKEKKVLTKKRNKDVQKVKKKILVDETSALRWFFIGIERSEIKHSGSYSKWLLSGTYNVEFMGKLQNQQEILLPKCLRNFLKDI